MRVMSSLMLVLSLQVSGTVPGDRDVTFRWAVAARSAAAAGTLVPLENRSTLSAGDELALLLESRCRCFFFVLYESAQKELTVLIPSLATMAAPLEPGNAVTLPISRPRKLDERLGTHTLHLIASATPPHRLITLLTAYLSSAAEQRPSRVSEVLQEIRALKKQHLTARSVERPVAIAGRTRGANADLAPFAVTIASKSFYSRTYTIEYR